jgi:hypothetical protein
MSALEAGAQACAYGDDSDTIAKTRDIAGLASDAPAMP